jgi:lysophospholipase L1-like esterase
MIRRLGIAVAAFALAVTTALAPSPSSADTQPVYLSLGTSLAAGTLADASGNSTILFSDASYTDQLASWLWNVHHVKLGCPGETIATFTNGGICYQNGASQLSLAKWTLAAGHVRLVTIDLGANDFLQAEPQIDACAGDGSCVYAILNDIATRLGQVLDALRAANGRVRIIGMNYYNPNLAIWLGHYPGVPYLLAPNHDLAMQSNTVSLLANSLIAAQFKARNLELADVQTAFSGTDWTPTDPSGTPRNVQVICGYTSMCPTSDGVSPNIHPTRSGYTKIATAFANVIWRDTRDDYSSTESGSATV